MHTIALGLPMDDVERNQPILPHAKLGAYYASGKIRRYRSGNFGCYPFSYYCCGMYRLWRWLIWGEMGANVLGYRNAPVRAWTNHDKIQTRPRRDKPAGSDTEAVNCVGDEVKGLN